MSLSSWKDILYKIQQETHEFHSADQLTLQLEKLCANIAARFEAADSALDPYERPDIERREFFSLLQDVISRESFNPEEIKKIVKLFSSLHYFELVIWLGKHFAAMVEPEFLLHFKARSLMHLGEKSAAQTLFLELTGSDPCHSMTHFEFGYLHLMSGQLEQAATQFACSLEKQPGFAPALLNLAGCHFNQGQYEQAIECASQLLLEPEYQAKGYVTVAVSSVMLSDFEQAERWVTEAQACSVQDAEIHRVAGIVCHEKKRYLEAVEYFDRYLDSEKENLDVVHMRARSLAEAGNWQRLRKDVARLLEFEPYDVWCLTQLFLCCFHLKCYPEAFDVLSKLRKLGVDCNNRFGSEIEQMYKSNLIISQAL